jgi:sigma-E factor negative regulatory protein RseB
MTQPLHSRTYWLLPCALLGALLGSVPQARGADDARAWLEKMNKALATRNYDGTFFHISGGRVETMRIVHRVRSGRVTERLQSLDGSGREFVRANDELTCYLPDQHTVLVEPRQDRGPFLGSLPQFDSSVSDFYRIEALPAAHILGRAARVIAVNPKDQFRFGYRLWLDEKTAMPLKTQLCDSRGTVLEQIFFARLEMPESIPDSDLAPTVRTDGMRWVRQGPAVDNASAALAAYRASQLPPGFRLTVQGATQLRFRRCSGTGPPYPAADARARPGRRRLRILHHRAGSSSYSGGRGSRSNGRVHCPLGENLQRRDSSSLNPSGSCCTRVPGAACARKC